MKNLKGSISVDKGITYMIGVLVLVILLFTWFLPTINGASGINNTTTLWIGATNYTWFVPVVAIMILVAFVYMLWKGVQS